MYSSIYSISKLLIGTCGYGYKEWTGPVYPEGTKDREKLGLYSGLFPTVELDNTYYGMPKAKHMAKKLVDGGPDLTFSIKANDSLTHQIKPAEWEERAKIRKAENGGGRTLRPNTIISTKTANLKHG